MHTTAIATMIATNEYSLTDRSRDNIDQSKDVKIEAAMFFLPSLLLAAGCRLLGSRPQLQLVCQTASDPQYTRCHLCSSYLIRKILYHTYSMFTFLTQLLIQPDMRPKTDESQLLLGRSGLLVVTLHFCTIQI